MGDPEPRELQTTPKPIPYI